MSLSLAVRHRPRRFADVAGQRTAVEVLSAIVDVEPVPQQILLAGPSGVGKTTLARIFAAALFCPERVDNDACGVCSVCESVAGLGEAHLDLIELDAASHGGVDQIRALADEAHLLPAHAPYRVYVIDEAHGLTRDGGQAFLKLLEEPPAHTLFILATTDPQKLPTALRGRCLSLYVTAPDRADLVNNLARVAYAENWDVPREVLELVVDASEHDLGVRGTVTTLEKLSAAFIDDEVDVASAAHLLGVTDPHLFANLTAAVASGDRLNALRLLFSGEGQISEVMVLNQLARWAHTQMRAAVEQGHDPVLPAWWLEVFTRPAMPLELRIAQACSPSLGGVAGLEAMCVRAEQLLDALAQATNTTPVAHETVTRPEAFTPPVTQQQVPPPASTTTTVLKPAPADTPPVAAPPPSSPEVTQPPAAERTAEDPAGEQVWEPVDVADPDFVQLANAVGKIGGGRTVLALRRSTLQRADNVWSLDSDDETLHTAFRSALNELGWVTRT